MMSLATAIGLLPDIIIAVSQFEPAGGLSQALSDSPILALGALFAAGVLTSLTPCVYPMIPIIISFFGKLSEDKHIGKTTVAVLYGSGIAGTFIFIGLLGI